MTNRLLTPCALLWCLASAGCEGTRGATSPWHFAELGEPADVSVPPETLVVAHHVRSYGELDGPAAIGGVSGLAVSPTVLAVSDPTDCEIKLFSRTDGSVIGRVGRCGAGPGEFRRPGALAFRGDSIIVFDDFAMAAILLGTDGREHRRVRFPPIDGPVGRPVTRVDPLGDGTFLLHTGVRPPRAGRPGTTNRTPVSAVAVSWERGEPLRAFLPSGEGPMTHVRNTVTTHASCVVPAANGDGPFLVAMNMWVPQLIVQDLSEAGRPVTNALIRSLPIGTRPQSEDNPALVATGLVRAACGDSVAMIVFRRLYGRGMPAGPRDAQLVLVEPRAGTFRTVRLAESDTLFRGELLAAHGRSYFFVRRDGDFPRVVEVALR